jgi:hypothetical protein
MNILLAFWLPILLSGVVVFGISSLIHLVFKWHASDYNGLANEDAVRDGGREFFGPRLLQCIRVNRRVELGERSQCSQIAHGGCR